MTKAGTMFNNKFRKIRNFDDFCKLRYFFRALSAIGYFASDSLLEKSLQYLTFAQKQNIVDKLSNHASYHKLDIQIHQELCHEELENMDEFLKKMAASSHLARKMFIEILSELQALLDKFEKRNLTSILRKKTEEVTNLFELNNTEKEVLLLFYYIISDMFIETLFDELCEALDISPGYNNTNRYIHPFSILIDLNRNEIRQVFHKNGKLFRYQLVDSDYDLAPEISSYLNGYSQKPIIQHYFSEYEGEAIPLQQHIIPEESINTIQLMINRRKPGQGINILLYGVPGTGKTEFVRSLGRHLNRKIFEIKRMDESEKKEKNRHFRIQAYWACQKIVHDADSLIVMDEADNLLNSDFSFFSTEDSVDKGLMNQILDESSLVTVWITNRFEGIDESVRRRFDFSIRFEKLTTRHRRLIWKNRLTYYKLQKYLNEESIQNLVEDYELSAGGIDLVLRNFAKLRHDSGNHDFLENLIQSHLNLMNLDKGQVKKWSDIKENYTLEGLNIKGDIKSTLNYMARFTEKRKSDVRKNINCFLYGPPGSGKTEFARYLSRRFNLKLLEKKGSDLLSPYVGMTEQNIAAAFREANREQEMLFIDEVDSFLFSRQQAVRSWEVSMINELLVQLENHNTIVICATNFKDIMDSAAIRRFQFKLQFDYLKSDGITIFYEKFFKKLICSPMRKIEKKELLNLNYLTPADLALVYQQAEVMGAKKLKHNDIIEMLRREMNLKNENIKHFGFN